MEISVCSNGVVELLSIYSRFVIAVTAIQGHMTSSAMWLFDSFPLRGGALPHINH